MSSFTISRGVSIPDVTRIRRYERSPDLGPNILFFSGGTALGDISSVLKNYTHNSCHLVTAFDSGGSSAVLRKAFDMVAIGDLRARLMALADESISGQPEIVQLFATRLSKEKKPRALLDELHTIADGKDDRIRAIKNPMRDLIKNHLQMFMKAMPKAFDLRGASIGNLILTGGYLNNNRRLDSVIFMFSKLINAQGQVLPIIDGDLHMGVELEDGRTIIGQHLITGKETAKIDSPIVDVFLTESLRSKKAVQPPITKKRRRLIQDADLICYPPGSFYSSLCVNFLPKGVGKAIQANQAPKVYFPSLGNDPEQLGLSRDESVFKLLDILKRDVGEDVPATDLLDAVFVDRENGIDLKPKTRKMLNDFGVHVIDTRLVSPHSAPYYDPHLFSGALLSMT